MTMRDANRPFALGLGAALALSTTLAGASCARPLYLTFDTGHMGVAPLIAEVLADGGVQLLSHGVVAHAEIPDLRRHASNHVHGELALVGLADPAALGKLLQHARALALGAKSDFDDNPTYEGADRAESRAIAADAALYSIVEAVGSIAIAASDGAVAQATAMRRARDLRDAQDREGAQAIASKLVATTITIKVKAGAEGRLFGSVKTEHIAEAVAAAGLGDIDKRKVDGVGVDLNSILTRDYGQWSLAGAVGPAQPVGSSLPTGSIAP